MPNAWPLVRLEGGIRQRSEFVRIEDLRTYKRVRVQLHAMPPANVQRRTVPAFERIRVLKRLQAETSGELGALLASILDKAFRGEL